MRYKELLLGTLVLALTACSLPDDEDRLANQGLPPSDTVGSVDLGRSLYAEHCASCHGKLMTGSESGPPLLHKVYEPGHHANLAFYRAIRDGVRAHHWQFGDMPPQPQVSPTDGAHIIAYIRSRQQKAGIR